MPNQKLSFSPSCRLRLEEDFFFCPPQRLSRRGITFEASPPFQKGQNMIQSLLPCGLKERQHLKRQHQTARTAEALSAGSTTTHSEEALWDESVFHPHCVNLLSDPALSQTCVCRHIARARGHSAHQSQAAPNGAAQVRQHVGGPGFTSGSTADNPGRAAIRPQHTSGFSPSAAATARFFGGENRVLSNVGGGGQKGRAAHLAGRSEKGKKMKGNIFVCVLKGFSAASGGKFHPGLQTMAKHKWRETIKTATAAYWLGSSAAKRGRRQMSVYHSASQQHIRLARWINLAAPRLSQPGEQPGRSNQRRELMCGAVNNMYFLVSVLIHWPVANTGHFGVCVSTPA